MRNGTYWTIDKVSLGSQQVGLDETESAYMVIRCRRQKQANSAVYRWLPCDVDGRGEITLSGTGGVGEVVVRGTSPHLVVSSSWKS